jgi:hypothetical protein
LGHQPFSYLGARTYPALRSVADQRASPKSGSLAVFCVEGLGPFGLRRIWQSRATSQIVPDEWSETPTLSLAAAAWNLISQSPKNFDGGLTRLVVSIVVVPVLVLDAMLRPLYGPLVRAVARLRLLAAITAQIIRLPPYGIRCVLAVPFVIAEPLKIIALYWMGSGHFIRGAATMAFAYGLSFVLVERIYDAGREKLKLIGWLPTCSCVGLPVTEMPLWAGSALPGPGEARSLLSR